MEYSELGLKKLEDIANLVNLKDFKLDSKTNSFCLIDNDSVSYNCPNLYFDSTSDVDYADRSGKNFSMYGCLHDINKNRKNTFISVLNDVFFVSDVSCILDNNLNIIHPNTYADSSINDMTYYCDRSSKIVTQRKVINKEKTEFKYFLNNNSSYHEIETPVVLLSSQSSANIYHWLIETVPRLWCIEEFPELKNYKFIIHNVHDPKVIEIMNKFDIPLENLISLDPNAIYKFKKFVYPSAINDLVNSKKKFDFIRKVFNINDISHSNNKKRYYITRNDTVGRRTENEEEVVKILNKYNIEYLTMSKISLQDLANLFFDAELLIGPMGSGLLNMIYMNPGSAVIEMATKSWSGLFWTMGSGAGHHYSVLGSKADYYLSNSSKAYTYGMPDSMEYDIEKLELVIKESLKLIER